VLLLLMRIRNMEIITVESHHLSTEMKGETRAWSQLELKEEEVEEIRTNQSHVEVSLRQVLG
jgi:hypothetical protein